MAWAQARGSKKYKTLWDFTVQTDHEIYGRRPDVIVVQKDKNFCQIIDFFALWWKSGYQRIRKKKNISKIPYKSWVEKDMERKSQGYTTCGRCPMNITYKIKKLGKRIRYWNQITEFKKTVLLHTARILQKVLEVYENLLL